MLSKETKRLRKRVGNFIRSRREALSLSRRELCSAVGIKVVGTLTHIEMGEMDLPDNHIKLMARILDVNPSSFERFVHGGFANFPSVVSGPKMRADRVPNLGKHHRLEVGKYIQRRRKQLGMASRDFGLKVGYKTTSGVSNIECGAANVPKKRIVVFAKHLQINADEFARFVFGEVESMEEAVSKSTLTVEERELLYYFRGLSKRKRARILREIGELVGS